MLEAAVVIDLSGAPIHWHLPAERTAVHLPDSRSLWQVLWAERQRLAGVAHTHPGVGSPAPSWEDLTTFAACEAGLGRRLDWWIATMDQIRLFRWAGPSPHRYLGCPLTAPPAWLPQLRARSTQPSSHTRSTP